MPGLGLGIGGAAGQEAPIVGGAPAIPEYADIGHLVIQLDDGAYTIPTTEMTAMTNQAPVANRSSLVWTANNAYEVIADANGSGRVGFKRAAAGEWLDSDVTDAKFANPDGGIFIGYVTKTYVSGTTGMVVMGSSVVGDSGTCCMLESDARHSSIVNNASILDISAQNAHLHAVWHTNVWVYNATHQKIYTDAADVTSGTPSVWDATDNIFPQFAMASANANTDYDILGIYVYKGVATLTQVNNLGQRMADEFGFTQTWALS